MLDYLKGTTINVSIAGYYDYNFNNPIGRVNLLRASDVSSNAFRPRFDFASSKGFDGSGAQEEMCPAESWTGFAHCRHSP